LSLLQGLGETFQELLFGSATQSDKMQRAEAVVAAYNDAMERVLGAPTGSLNLINAETLNEWFVVDDHQS